MRSMLDLSQNKYSSQWRKDNDLMPFILEKAYELGKEEQQLALKEKRKARMILHHKKAADLWAAADPFRERDKIKDSYNKGISDMKDIQKWSGAK